MDAGAPIRGSYQIVGKYARVDTSHCAARGHFPVSLERLASSGELTDDRPSGAGIWGITLPLKALRIAVLIDPPALPLELSSILRKLCPKERRAQVPSKLFIRVEPEARFVAATDGFEELSRLPLDVGKQYLVQASGVLGVQAGVTMRMRLDVRSFFGSVLASQEIDYINNHQQFMVVTAANVPAEGGAGSEGAPVPPGASANLSVRTFWPTPPSPGQSVYATEMTIVALTVDEIVAA
jgi:hypothetical protein